MKTLIYSVLHTHTHTHTRRACRIKFRPLPILFAILSLVHVESMVGQLCPNQLLDNAGLTYTGPTSSTWFSFFEGGVEYWYSSSFTPHHVDEQITNNNGQLNHLCLEGSTFNCLAVKDDWNWAEGIFTNVEIKSHPELSYTFDLRAQILECSSIEGNFANLEVRASNGLVNNNGVPFGAGNDPDFEIIGNPSLSFYNVGVFKYSNFQPTKDFTQLEIMSLSGNDVFVTLSDLMLSCQTSALGGINSVQSLNNYDFSPINTSHDFDFTQFYWQFEHIENSEIVYTSSSENITYDFTVSGHYNVRLEVLDENGCCASTETTLDICPPLDFYIKVEGECPDYRFSAIGLPLEALGLTYTWDFGDGTTGTGKFPSHSFTENGTYNVICTITDLCGGVFVQSVEIVICCIEPLMGDLKYEVACLESGNLVTLFFEGTGSDLSFNWDFGDGNNLSSNTALVEHTYLLDGTYTVTLNVTNECDDTITLTQTLVVTCRVTCPPNSGFTLYGVDGEWSLSQLFDHFSVVYDPAIVNNYSNLHFDIHGILTIDISADFLNCHFVANEGSKLIVDAILTPPTPNNKGYTIFNGCKFYGCEAMWQGIEARGNPMTMWNGLVRDALYGIHVNNDSEMMVYNSTLSHNFVGMYFASNPYHIITGNTFTGGTLLPPYRDMPSYAHHSLCGIYAQGPIYTVDSPPSAGNNSLFVGYFDAPTNAFHDMDNGVICNGVNYIQFENNEFSNIIGNLTNLYVDASLGSEVKGRGIFIKGGGFFGGVHIRGSRFNNVTKGVNTVSVPNAVNVTQNNVFTNVYDGVIATNNNTIFPLNLNVKGNVFDCTRYGVFSNNNIGHDFIVQDNYFSQPANAVTNSGGLRILANTPGFFGRQGKGNVLRNEFFNEAINHSNGSLQISNINSVEVTQGNKVHILGISNNPALNGHQGFNFTNVNSTLVTDNILRNMTGISYQGSNLWSNSTNNAVCCNELYGMQSGLSLINIGTDRSTIKHNLLDDNAQGIQLTTNCKIGDQIDHGNVWTGASRVAKYTDIDTDKNRFHANQEQNTATQWFWPTQKPRVWFIESSNVASDICDNICDVPLGDIAEATEPSISSIAILEEMLDHDHIVSEAQREPGIWAKERWLYGYLTQYPHLRDLSVPLTDFYDHVAEDVKLYEDFYRALLDVVTPPENELAASVEAGLEAESIINQANLLWAQYRDQPSAVVKDALDALQADLAAIVPSGAVYLEASNDSRLAALHTLKTEIENLPTNKPYTAVAQQYAYILLDAFIYGDGYVQQHHLVDLIAVAQLCEPLYKESVVCARNMLVSLGYTPDYDDTMCQEYTQPRSSVDIDSDQISVSPNPTSGRIHIDAEQKINGITIQDVHGTVIKEVKGEARQIDISDMSDGMYYMTIYTMSHAVIVKKIIKIQ